MSKTEDLVYVTQNYAITMLICEQFETQAYFYKLHMPAITDTS